MKFLDAMLSLAVGFCLTGGLFWFVSRMKGCRALRNIGHPNFAPCTVPYPVRALQRPRQARPDRHMCPSGRV